MFKFVRITILSLILASVASTVLLQRNVSSGWIGTLDLRIIPIVADDSPTTLSYVENLEQADFDNIERYLIRQAARYKTDLSHGLNIRLSKPIYNVPPVTPRPDSSSLEIGLWSLSLRWWAWRNQPSDYHNSQIRLYVLYQDTDGGVSLAHSIGLRNALIGLIYARVNDSNKEFDNVVITHELLHIFGAVDKYDLFNGKPAYPDGYAQPNLMPVHPQNRAEIMGRSIPISENRHEVAPRLKRTMIGPQTAKEIAWTK
ncbi:MAG: hypothetical protein ACI9WC_003479 [Arenicella sp.]|jgi:hypothetical protein